MYDILFDHNNIFYRNILDNNYISAKRLLSKVTFENIQQFITYSLILEIKNPPVSDIQMKLRKYSKGFIKKFN